MIIALQLDTKFKYVLPPLLFCGLAVEGVDTSFSMRAPTKIRYRHLCIEINITMHKFNNVTWVCKIVYIIPWSSATTKATIPVTTPMIKTPIVTPMIILLLEQVEFFFFDDFLLSSSNPIPRMMIFFDSQVWFWDSFE